MVGTVLQVADIMIFVVIIPFHICATRYVRTSIARERESELVKREVICEILRICCAGNERDDDWFYITKVGQMTYRPGERRGTVQKEEESWWIR